MNITQENKEAIAGVSILVVAVLVGILIGAVAFQDDSEQEPRELIITVEQEPLTVNGTITVEDETKNGTVEDGNVTVDSTPTPTPTPTETPENDTSGASGTSGTSVDETPTMDTGGNATIEE